MYIHSDIHKFRCTYVHIHIIIFMYICTTEAVARRAGSRAVAGGGPPGARDDTLKNQIPLS